jgi:hypothetical protein
MPTPPVRCLACDRAWHSATLTAGLRTLGACPRCGGELAFAAPPPPAGDAKPDAPAVAPHQVLGVPRR